MMAFASRREHVHKATINHYYFFTEIFDNVKVINFIMVSAISEMSTTCFSLSELNVNVHDSLSRLACRIRRLYNLHPSYWNTLSYSLISSGENSAFAHVAEAIARLQFSFSVPPGTHHCWVDRGGMI